MGLDGDGDPEPDAGDEGVARADRALAALVDAAGGPTDFLDRYAVVLCSDHGQTRVERGTRLQAALSSVGRIVVTASNRAGMIYRLRECELEPPELAALACAEPAVDFAAYLEGDELVVRRREGEGLLDEVEYPLAEERLRAALRNPNAGEVLVSAAPGAEFEDLGGRHHVGGGSHGSLCRGDSEVPILLVGIEGDAVRIVDLAPLVLAHLGVAAPVPAHA